MLRRRRRGMCRMSCGLVSRSTLRLRHDHRHDLCRIGNALLNSNMAGHMVAGPWEPSCHDTRQQAAGTRHLPAFIQCLQWLRSLLNFAFCMSSMSNVLTFDFAVAPTTTATATATGRPCWLGKCSLMSQKFIAGLHAVCAPCPNLGKRQKWQHKPNKKPKKKKRRKHKNCE